MARKIVITSGKGGVGKTTLCCNLGYKLASLGFRVALIDADIGLNNLDVVMGVENRVVFDIADVIENRCRLKQALVQDKKIPTLYVLPSCHSYPKGNITSENIKAVIDKMDADFDYIFIDCPAGVETGFHRAVFSANEALVVVTPHISSIRDADKVLSILASYNLEAKYLVINRVRGDLMMNKEMIDVEEIIRFLKIQIIGIVPEDDDISLISSVGGTIQGNSSSRAFTLIAENLHNGTKKIYDYTIKYRGLLGSIRRNLKRRV